MNFLLRVGKILMELALIFIKDVRTIKECILVCEVQFKFP